MEAPSSPAEWICLSLPVCLLFAVFQPPRAPLSVCISVCISPTPPPTPTALSVFSLESVPLSLDPFLPFLSVPQPGSPSLFPWLLGPFARLHLLLALSC